MSLYGRITAQDNTKIHVHRFGSALRELASGGVTRAQVISTFALSAAETTELDAIIASYNALGSGNASAAFQKAVYTQRLEDVFILCETGDYTEAQAKSRLGF